MIQLPDDQKLTAILNGRYHLYDKDRMSFVHKIMSSILFHNNLENKYVDDMINISTLSKLYMDSNMNVYFKGQLNKYIASSIIADFWYTMNSIKGYAHTLKYIQYNYSIDSMSIKISKGLDPFNLDKFGYRKDTKWNSTCQGDIRIGTKRCIDLDKCLKDIKIEKKCTDPYIMDINDFMKLSIQEQVLQLKRELEIHKLKNRKSIYEFDINDSLKSCELKKIKLFIQNNA